MELITQKRILNDSEVRNSDKKLKKDEYENLDEKLYYNGCIPIQSHYSFICMKIASLVHVFENPYVMTVDRICHESWPHSKRKFIKMEAKDYKNLVYLTYENNDYTNLKFTKLLFDQFIQDKSFDYFKIYESQRLYGEIVEINENTNLERNYIYEKINGDGYLELYFLNVLYCAIEILPLKDILNLRAVCKRFANALFPYYLFYRINSMECPENYEHIPFSPAINLWFWLSYTMENEDEDDKTTWNILKNGFLSAHKIDLNINAITGKWDINLNIRNLRYLNLHIMEEEDDDDPIEIIVNCKELNFLNISGLEDRIPILNNIDNLIEFSLEQNIPEEDVDFDINRTKFLLNILSKSKNLKKLQTFSTYKNIHHPTFIADKIECIDMKLNVLPLTKLQTSSNMIIPRDLERLLNYTLNLETLIYRTNFHYSSIFIMENELLGFSQIAFGWTRNIFHKSRHIKENIKIGFIEIKSEIGGYNFYVEERQYCSLCSMEQTENKPIVIPLLKKLKKAFFINCKK